MELKSLTANSGIGLEKEFVSLCLEAPEILSYYLIFQEYLAP